MADLKISALNSLAGADLVAADVVAVVDDSASETKKLTVSDLIANGSTLISDNTIPSAKILFSAGAIDTAELAASSVETAKINDSAVTAAKLADNSSVTLVSTLPASGDFIGQIALDTDDSSIVIWDGSAWLSPAAPGSINVINGSTTGEINIVATTSGSTVTISATLDDTGAAAQFLAGPTGAAGTVGYRAIIGTDLPTANTTAKGGVIVNGNGLVMSGDTIAIDNTVTAETSENHIVQYDANGLVTGGRAIAAADVPNATSTTVGVIKPGSGLGVTGAGELNHDNSVTAGTAAKVTFDTEGHITGTESLVAADIPDLDADKITSGAFPTARIASDAITADKLANYTVAQISETTPTADFTSQFFFNPITRDLFLWDGNVFQPVGISAGEIVLAGTYDASTNLLDSVTAEGSAAGFTNGQSLPAADTGNNRYYVVVTQTGTGSAPAPTVTLEPPDILLSNGTSYVLVETSETITAQVASNVGFTPTGNIAGTNVQAALSEVDSEKLAKGGDTMTGDLTLNNVNVVFEGATENEYETTLTAADPTADNTLTLPDNSGSLVSTGDTGSVTSTMIADGTIVNADISASAEIAVSKLANGTARQLLQTDVAGSGVEFTSNVDVPGTLDVTGAATLDSTLDVTGVISADGKIKFPAGSASAPSFYSGTDTNTGLYFSAADEVSITTAGTQRVVVDSIGDVGIGTSSPSQRLQVVGGSIQLDTEVGVAFGDINTRLQGVSDGTFKFIGNSNERLRIDSSGNVGIGTSSPKRQLHVSGTVLGTGTAPQVRLSTDSNDASDDNRAIFGLATSAGNFFGGSVVGDVVLRTTNGGNLLFGEGTTERLRIDSSGNVGINRTTPSAALDVESASDQTVLRLRNNGGNNTRLLFANAAAGLGEIFYQGDFRFVDDENSDAERLRIDSSGNVGIGTSSPAQPVHIANGLPVVRLEDTSTNAYSEIQSDNAGNLYLRADHGNDEASSSIRLDVDGSERMRIDSSGYVGINKTPSTYQFEVSGGTSNTIASFESTDATARILFKDNSGEAFVGGTGDAVTFYTSSSATERMRIDSSGRLLIGTTSTSGDQSDGDLVVQGASQGELYLSRGSTPANTGGGLGFIHFTGDNGEDSASIRVYSDGGTWTNGSSHPSSMRFETTADGASSPTERLRIDSSGNVGIGTTSPGDYNSGANKLVVSDTGSTGLTIATGTSAAGGIYFADGTTGNEAYRGYIEFSHSQEYMRFGTAASEKARIDSSGNVLLGTSSPINSSQANGSLILSPTLTGSVQTCMQIENNLNTTATGGKSYIDFYNGNSTEIGSITGNQSGISYNTSSDYRLKENVVDIADGITRVKQLAPKRFNFIADADTTVDGFLAHEAQTVVPEAVTGTHNEVDDDGNPVMQGIDQSKLVPLLTAALQEAIAKIETLETKVAALEAE